MNLTGDNVVVIVSLVIWTGIFLWLLRLSKRVRTIEKTEKES